MKKSLNTALFAGAFVALSAPAYAAPVSIVFGNDTSVENEEVGIDIFGDVTVDANGDVTLAGPDGNADIAIGDYSSDGFAEIFAALQILFPGDDLEFEPPSYFTSVGFATDRNNGLLAFNPEDDIADLAVGWTPYASLYENGTDGVLGAEGSSALIGFRVEVFENDFQLPDPDFDFTLCIDTNTPPPGCEAGGAQTLVQTHYGWLELARGSVKLNGGAFNTAANQTIAAGVGPGGMAAVPLPAAGWMLLAGLGGLGALKRRKKA